MAEEKIVKVKLTLAQKLLKARIQLSGLKQTGSNDHAKYAYFELSDFVPKINKINDELGIFSFISFTRETATLTLINTEDASDTLTITSPMAGAKLPNCHEIQNLGAVESYQRRYLYMTAYEITEPDKLEQGVPAQSDGVKEKSNEEILNDLTKEWGLCRTKLASLGKDVRSAKTNNYICTMAEIKTQNIAELGIEEARALVDTYHKIINTLTGNK